ncbi:hypothetical protein ACFYO2_48915 [Streptomyces sp. NPDC006602]|uniref:hypothetical protein n=1 Tax=Streptomyces sp. NPDC006602 TaxID=3364751 RepID=UPI0036995F82
MQTDASFWDSLVFDGIDDVDVEAVTAAFGRIDVVARSRAAGANCPDCGCFSDRVHDSAAASATRSPPGSTPSMPASCPASPDSNSTCSETSTP